MPTTPAPEALDELAQVIPAIIFRADLDGNWIYASERWRHFTNRDPAGALGTGWLDAVHPEERERVAQSWHRAISARTPFAEDFHFIRDDEGVVAVWCRARPRSTPDGRLLEYVGAICDISERARSEGMLKQLTDQLSMRVRELDCHYGISHVVEEAGGSLDTILRRTVQLLPASWEHSEITCARIVLDDREYRTDTFQESPWCQRAAVCIHGKPVGRVEVYYMEARAERDEGPFLASERTLINDVGERLGHIAERLRVEELLRERETELRERMTHLTRVGVMGEMASSIAHEVNQPLTAISTYAQALRRLVGTSRIESKEALDVLERIGDEALRAGGIIHRLKDLVKKRQTRREERDLNALILDLQPLAQVDARLHDVQLHMELADSLPAVFADGVQIQQVVLNLIRNAIDAMVETEPDRRAVIVRSEARTDGYAEVSVLDRGCGMPPEAEDALFEPFFTTKEGGMGMGLSVSRTIVTSHGGRMWFTRRPDGGTIMTFTLPPLSEVSNAVS